MCAVGRKVEGRRIGVADVLKAGFKWCKFKFSEQQWKVFNAIIACRSGKLGAHLLRCTQCHRIHFIPLSCRNRHCPSCQGAAAADWLARQERALLPVPYFHAVFTVPHTLNPLVRVNPKELHRILFNAASQTLLEFGRKNLGAQLGVTAVLHTWGQTLSEHYHLHCVVTGGGLANDGSLWVSPPGKKPYLFCTKALSKVYRGKYVSELKKLYDAKELKFHGESAPLARKEAFDQLVRTLYRQDWVVYSKPPFAGPKQVLAYLSRYTHRVAISDHRILALDEQRRKVTIRYKDYRREGRSQTLTLDIETFIKRLSLHILPKRLTKIRHYGILSNRTRQTKIKRCRQLLGVDEIGDENPNVTENVEDKRYQLPERCPYCQGETLEYLDITHSPVRISKERAPPVAA